MYIQIKGFRTIQQYECEFQSESITLISGPSGVGKTTLMNAIFWCLYGTLKNVRKFGTKSGTCMVNIDLGNMRMTRSKSPETLLVEEISGEDVTATYKDDEAQERIVNLFGSSMIWLSSCYLSQGTRNKFLESPPSERLSLLSELCFSNQSPEIHIEKIDEKMKDVTKEFERENDFYKRDLDLFQKRRKEYPKYKEDLLNSQLKQSCREKVHSEDLLRLEEQLSTSERLESTYLSLSDTKNQLYCKFPNYKDYLLSSDQKNILTEIISRDRSTGSPSNRRGGEVLVHIENEIQELTRKKVLLSSYLDQYNQKRSEHNFIDHRKYLLSKDSLTEMNLLMNRLHVEIDEMEKRWRSLIHHKTNYSTWTKEFEDLKVEINSFRTDVELKNLLEDVTKKIQMTKESLETKRKREDLFSKLKDYEDILCVDIESRKIESQEMNDSILKEKKIEERRNLLSSMSVQDRKDFVQKAIDIRKRVIEVQSLWPFVDELQTLESRMNELDEKIAKLKSSKGVPWISEKDLPEKILELNLLKETLICPKCTTTLRFESSHLVECRSPMSKDKIDQLSKCIEDSKRRLELFEEKQILEDKMNHMIGIFETNCQKMNITQEGLYDFPKLEESEKQKLYQEMNELEKLLPTYEYSFISSDKLCQMNRKWEAKIIQDKIDHLIEGPNSSTDLSESDHLCLEREKEDLVRECSFRNHMEQRMKHLRSFLDDVKVHMDECEDCSLERIDQSRKRLDDIREIFQNHNKSKEIFEIEEKIQLLGVPIENLDQCLNHIDDEILSTRERLEKEWKKIEDERKRWEEAKEKMKLVEDAEMIREMDEKMEGIVFEDPREIKNKIQNLKTEIEECKIKLLRCEKAEELSNEKSRLEQQRSEVIHLSSCVSRISMMKMMANELEHKRMISILDTINDFANEILTILFDEPIKIEFMVYKKSKTNDKIKPSIVYKLLYKGYEMDHVDQLSGGEGDRVSLAVTCALFHFSKFPFLLLDEFASSLDLNTKEIAIKSLKAFLGIGQTDIQEGSGTKGILCISHDTVEGIYDCIIPLEKSNK